MTTRATLRPLYPFTEGHNFQVGPPLNGAGGPYEPLDAFCRCEGYEYDGSDERIQYPVNWHVCAGCGGLAGGFHQNCEGTNFQPLRCAVVRDSNKPRNLIHLDGTGFEKVYVARWFERELWHPEASAESNGEGLRVEFIFRVSGDAPYEWNVEARGRLNVAVRKNEAVQCMGVHMHRGLLMVAYWKDAVTGSRVDEHRLEHKFPFVPRAHAWHRLTLDMFPTVKRSEWATQLRIKSRGAEVFRFDSDTSNHANNIESITQIGFGKELERVETVGTMDVARAMCWATPPVLGTVKMKGRVKHD